MNELVGSILALALLGLAPWLAMIVAQRTVARLDSEPNAHQNHTSGKLH